MVNKNTNGRIILPYPCNCGGKLKKAYTQVEFFGIDFGVRPCEVCSQCGSEYLNDETLQEIEKEVKRRKLFGLEKQARITKSGNSLVIRISPEIAKFSDIHYNDSVRMYPLAKNKLALDLGAK